MFSVDVTARVGLRVTSVSVALVHSITSRKHYTLSADVIACSSMVVFPTLRLNQLLTSQLSSHLNTRI